MNPDRQEAHVLKQWWDTQDTSQFESLTISKGGGGRGNNKPFPRKLFSAVKDENLGTSQEQADFFSVRGTITWISRELTRPPWYTACPQEGCNKKVTEDATGQWHCTKCNKSYPSCKPRYIMAMTCTDATGSQWVTAFNEVAEVSSNGNNFVWKKK